MAAVELSVKRWNFIVWGVIGSYFCLILAISLSYHWGYLSTLSDVGTFDQAVWATLHGYPFLNTNAFNIPVNYFGIHFRPILSIFLPFYALLPRIEWMIVAQSVSLALSGWPIYLLGRRILQAETAAFCIFIGYLVNPFMLSVPPWVFRPESLAVPFIGMSILGVERADFRLTMLSSLFIVLCKEHFGLMVVGIGVLWWLRSRNFSKSLILIGFGIIYTILVLSIIMPSLSPIGKHVMLGSNMGQLSRYSWLGSGFGEIGTNMFLNPLVVAKKIIEMGGVAYLFFLMAFFFAMPLAGAEFLLPGIADLAANLLSANPMPRGISYYHSVGLVPLLAIASIFGMNRISKWFKRYSVKELAIVTLVASISCGYLLAPLPLPGARNLWAPVQLMCLPEPEIPLIRKLVGDEASVAVQANVGAHFSQRKQIFQYPNRVGEVDAIILRLASPTKDTEKFPNFLGSLDGHLHMERNEYVKSIEKLLKTDEYGIILYKDPWLVLKRNVEGLSDSEEIEKKLRELKTEWKITRNYNKF